MGPLLFLTLDQKIPLAKIRDEQLDRIIRSLLKLFIQRVCICLIRLDVILRVGPVCFCKNLPLSKPSKKNILFRQLHHPKESLGNYQGLSSSEIGLPLVRTRAVINLKGSYQLF